MTAATQPLIRNTFDGVGGLMRSWAGTTCAAALLCVLAMMSGGCASQAVVTLQHPVTGPQLSIQDVRDWMASRDATGLTSYNENIPAFAVSVLRQFPPAQVDRSLHSEAAKAAAIDRAFDAFERIAASRGETEAIDQLSQMAAHLQDEVPLKPTTDQSAFAPLVKAQLLDIDFLSPQASDLWDSKLETITITGTDTVKVTYSATPSVPRDPSEHNPLSFRNPTLRYEQLLKFEYVGPHHWRLSGWPNYMAVKRLLESNVVPQSLVTDDLTWWNSTAPVFDQYQ